MRVRRQKPGAPPGIFEYAEVPDPPPPAPPCAHRGEPAGLGWYCDHPNPGRDPKIPDGEIVCGDGCSGKCTPRCQGYHAEPSELPPVPKPRRPRVLFASHDLSLTGAPTILANLIPFLRGIDPVVFSPHGGPLAERFQRAGVPVTTTLDLGGIDAVVANSLPSAPVVQRARDRGIPCAWLIHESVPGMCGNLPDVLDAIPYPREVVYPSRATAAAWESIRPGRVIHSTIPPVKLPTRGYQWRRYGAEGDFFIVSLGCDEPRKGQADIRAACEGMTGIQLYLVSGKDDPHDWLEAADLYICSSRVEAFPLSIQEAKAFGKPVITTPVFGCAEIIRDGIDGLHYQPGDVADLRAKIEAIRTDPELRARLSRPLTHLPTWDETVAEYESLVLDLCGMPTAQPVRVVYHSAGGWGPWWKDIVAGQFASLARCGLREVLGTHVGESPEWVIDEAARAGLRYTPCDYQRDVTAWECPAMRLIERICRRDDRPILYLHSKGASHDPASAVTYHDWRKLMQRELVERWREHLPKLGRVDLVGVNWWDRYPHFSGNFWLASAAWVRKLPPFDSVYRDRYTCERWIGMGARPRVDSLVCRDKKFWVEGPDMEFMYAALRGSP